MKKRTIITVLSVILVFILAIGAVAAVYLLQQAKVTVFNGRLGIPENSQPADEGELIVKIDGQEVGHEGIVAAYDNDIIPVLADVNSRYVDWNHYVWEDRDGNQALAAKDFIITAKNGALENLTYDINVVGNPSVVSTLRFGMLVEYTDDEIGRSTKIFTTSVYGVQLPEILGDSNIAEGEEIRVSVSVWADAYALADLENFDDMSFGVDFIFSAGEES